MPFRGKQWHGEASNVLDASHATRRRPHTNIRLSTCFQRTHAASLASTTHVDGLKATRSSKTARLSPSIGLFRDEPNINPDSLRNTLEAHREANRASLIVKIAGKGSGRLPITVPSLATRDETAEKLPDFRARSLTVSSTTEKRSDRKLQRRRRGGPELLAQWAPTLEARYSEKYPWMKHMKPRLQAESVGRLTGIEQLGREIDAFSLYSQATAQEERAAEEALLEISTAITEIDPRFKIDLVGSRATGLHSPLSDIDINVSTSTPQISKTSALEILQRIAKYLSAPGNNHGRFRSVMLISRPRVPILIGRHAPTYLEFQMQSTVDIFLSMQQIMSFVDEFPTLRMLFLLLKQMLAMRGLTQGSDGGLTSYPLLVMIVAALKFSEGKLDRRDAGGQLLLFLDMYSDIDFNKTAISFSPLEYIVKRHPHSSTLPQGRSAVRAPDVMSLKDLDSGLAGQEVGARRRFATIQPAAEFLMCLQDPANLQKDLGKPIYQIREVQDTFILLREKLKADLRHWERNTSNDQNPLLASCVGGDYRIFEDARNELRESVMLK
jgi:predicted nucleotidyltransferase